MTENSSHGILPFQATGSRVGTILQGVFTLVIALCVSLYYSWKLALVCSLFVPLLLVGIYFQMKVIMGHESIEKTAFEKSAHLAVQAITNIRTVAGLQCETLFADRFQDELTSKYALDLVFKVKLENSYV